MSEISTIECPSCGEEVSITEALKAEAEQKYEKAYLKKVQKAEIAIKDEKDKLDQEKKRLQLQQSNIQEEVKKKLSLEKSALELKLREEIRNDTSMEFEDLKNHSESLTKKLAEAQANELELRKRSRDLDERQKNIELEFQRRMDNQILKTQEETLLRASEDYGTKLSQKDKQLEDMKREIDSLKRKSEQVSQQLQGEAFEERLENLLKEKFVSDLIEPVAKGIKGADVLHTVNTSGGSATGKILWEMKQTKNWSDGWIDKLKEDQRTCNADYAILVSNVLPKNVRNFDFVDGVWICDLRSAIGLAIALRGALLQIYVTKLSLTDKTSKNEVLIKYFSGTQFKHRIEPIIEATINMKSSLEREKRSYQKIWATREQEILQIADNVVAFYGDMFAILGGALPSIPLLDLPDPEEEKLLT